jgi:hypothetical protein
MSSNQRVTSVGDLMTAMNVFTTGDQAKLSSQVAEWCHYLEATRSMPSAKPRNGR